MEGTSGSTGKGVRAGAKTVLKRLADAVTVSPFKGLGDAALQVLDVYDDVQTNKEECAALAKRVDNVTEDILQVVSHATELELDPSLNEDVNKLTQTVSGIATVMSELSKLSISRQVACGPEISDSIKKLELQLDSAYERFKIRNSLSQRLSLIRLEHTLQNPGWSSQANPTTSQSSSNIPPPRLPAKPGNFVGREDVLHCIVTALVAEANPHIAILGAGGIGKTAVALSVLHDPRIVQKFAPCRYFVACDGTTSAAGIVAILAGKLRLAGHQDPADAVLDHFQTLQCPAMIIFDNLESAWDTADRRNVEEFLCDLAAVETVALVVTMRGRQTPYGPKWTLLDPLSPLELSHARNLFLQISGREDENLDRLLIILDCWPLAVTLMATISQAGASPTHLLRRYQQEQTAMLNSGSDDRLSSVDVSIKMSLQSNAMQRDPQAQELLGLLSLLPDGVATEKLEDLFPNMPLCHRAAHTLQQTALAEQDNNCVLRVLSPIRLFMISYYPPNGVYLSDLENYYILLAGRSKAIGTAATPTILSTLTKEMGNIQAVLTKAVMSRKEKQSTAEAILAIARLSAWTVYGNCDELLRAAILALKDVASLQLQYASSMQALGVSLRCQLDFATATAMLEAAKAVHQRMENLSGEADCLRFLGDALRMQDLYNEATSMLIEAKAIYMQIGDRLGIAECLRSLASVLRMQGSYVEAGVMLDDARVIYKEMGDHQGEASCLRSWGNIQCMQERFAAATIILEDARGLYRQIGDRLGEADCIRPLGLILGSQGRYSEAQTMLKDALQLYEQIGDRWGKEECLLSLAKVTDTEASRLSLS